MRSDLGFTGAFLQCPSRTGLRPWERLPQASTNRATSPGCLLVRRAQAHPSASVEGGPMLVGSLLVFVDVVQGAAVDPLAAPLRLRHPAGAGVPVASGHGTGGRGHGPCPDDHGARLVASMPLVRAWKASARNTPNVSLVQSRQFAAQILAGLPAKVPRLEPC